MSHISSYPKIFNLGHKEVLDILKDPVLVEEKLDGSQFSFGVKDGELFCRSKGQQLIIDMPEKMFARAVDTAKALQPLLREGWVYRGEYLQSPKHNTLRYDRHPAQHIMIYDIQTGEECYLSYEEKVEEATRLGLEVVPLVWRGMIYNMDDFKVMLERVSCLGACKIEGVVIKNYERFTEDKKAMMAKFVSEDFKESHRTAWKNANPGRGDLVQRIIEMYRVPARWNKAVQHLRERGELTDSVKDIGPLLKEVGLDVRAECEAEIKELLFKWAWPQIQRGITGGLPQWYKAGLAERSFTQELVEGPQDGDNTNGECAEAAPADTAVTQ